MKILSSDMMTLQWQKPHVMWPIVFRRLPFQGLGMSQTKINWGFPDISTTTASGAGELWG